MKHLILAWLFFALQVCTQAYAIERIIAADVIEGQDTVKNLLGSKGHFEKNANGVVGFKDASAATPVDLYEATPSNTVVTCARTTSAPLSGVGSLLLTHTAADGRGEGCALAFTIDTKMKYSVLQVQFDYAIPSGTYADGDIQVWIYDVTNSVLIQPSGYSIKNHSVASGQVVALEFQATSGTSYRIGFWSSTTTATAYTMSIDDIKISKSAKLYGSPVTDWVSYTPTGSWTANSPVYSGKWRRVGDSMEVQALVSCGGAATAASLTFNLPSGHSIDTSKLLATSADQGVLGTGEVLDSGTQNYSPVNVVYSSTTAVGVYMTKTDGTYAVGTPVNATVPITFGLNDSVAISFKVPISGWSSSVIMSNDAATNVVAAFYNGQPTGTLAASDNLVTFPTKVTDTNGAYSSGTYTVAVPGKYAVDAKVRLSTLSATANQYFNLVIKQSGTEKATSTKRAEAASIDDREVHVFAELDCVAGDTIAIYSNTNYSSVTYNSAAKNSSLRIERISGPAQIAASETVAARYTTAAGQSIPEGSSTYTIVDFGTKDIDSHNAVTTGGSWKFTAPISGTYQVSASVMWTASTGAAGDFRNLLLYKNGAIQSNLAWNAVESTANIYLEVGGTALVRLLAGEYIDIRARNANAATAAKTLETSAPYNHVNITRVGNY